MLPGNGRFQMDTHTTPRAASAAEIAPGTRIGDLHLKVADLDRALVFWRDILGFHDTHVWTAPLMQGRFGRDGAVVGCGHVGHIRQGGGTCCWA
jgi:hypothetical protein